MIFEIHTHNGPTHLAEANSWVEARDWARSHFGALFERAVLHDQPTGRDALLHRVPPRPTAIELAQQHARSIRVQALEDAAAALDAAHPKAAAIVRALDAAE